MGDCKTCEHSTAVAPVPYIVHESAMARSERSIKRMFIALLIAIILLVASNAMWLIEWTQYDYASDETIYQQDGEGLNIIGDSNEAGIYGTESDLPD